MLKAIRINLLEITGLPVSAGHVGWVLKDSFELLFDGCLFVGWCFLREEVGGIAVDTHI